MGNMKDKLAVAAVEVGTTATGAAVGVAVAAAGIVLTPSSAGVLAAIPAFAKAAVELALDARRAREAREKREDEFVQEMHRQLETVLRQLERIKSESCRAAWRSPDYEEVTTLIQQFLDQAMKAPSSERRRMLAAAAAGSFRPDIGVESKSRAARVIEQLEPSDVIALRRLAKKAKRAQTWDEIRFAVEDEPFINSSTLLRLGCLIEKPVLNNHNHDSWSSGPPRAPTLRVLIDITPLAREVLRFLESYADTPHAKRASSRRK